MDNILLDFKWQAISYTSNLNVNMSMYYVIWGKIKNYYWLGGIVQNENSKDEYWASEENISVFMSRK